MIINSTLAKPARLYHDQRLKELLNKEDLREILKQLQNVKHNQSDESANQELDHLTGVIWNKYFATSFESTYLIESNETNKALQYVQSFIVTDLFKVLYNKALVAEEKQELIAAA